MPRLSELFADFWILMGAAALLTLVVGLMIIACRRPLSRMMRARDDARAVQASHVGNPLRLGGVAIFIGLTAGAAGGVWQDAALPALLILSAAPALLAGLGEDLGFCVSPLRRLAAAGVSALLAVLMLGAWVSRADLPGLDPVMAIMPLAVLLTVALSGGFCHSTNLVDGMNGLATTVILSAAVGLMLLAQDAGDRDLALIAILLAWRTPDIAVPALLLILFWPFADTFHSITRRVLRRAPVFEPDRMHLHQKMRRCIEIVLLGGTRRRLSNPLATLCLAPMIATPVVVGVYLSQDPRAAWIALVIFSLLFAVTNVLVTRFACARRRRYRGVTARLTHAE